MQRILPLLLVIAAVATLAPAVPVQAQTDLVYAALYEENNLGIVDPAQNKLIRRIQVGRNPDMVALNADNTKLYVSNTGEVTVSIVDLAGNRVSQVLRLPVNRRNIWAGVLGRSNDGSRIYVAERSENNEELRVYVVDTQKELIVGQFDAGRNISAVSVSHDGRKVFVANRGEGVTAYDAETYAKLGSITPLKGLAAKITGMACNPASPRAYITYGDANKLQVVSTDDYKTVAEIPTPKYKTGTQKDVVMSHDGKYAFVINHKVDIQKEVDGINVLETSKNEYIKLFNSGVCYRGIAVTADGKTGYIAADMLKWYNLETLEHIRSISLRTVIHGIAVVRQ